MFGNELAFDKLLDSLGAETLLDSLVRALTADEQRENFDYIARCFDIDLSDCESEAGISNHIPYSR